MGDKNWIKGAIKHPGSLRKYTKTKKGHNIPQDLLEELASKPGKIGAKARLAITLRKMHGG